MTCKLTSMSAVSNRMPSQIDQYFSSLVFKKYDIAEDYTTYIAAVTTYESTPKQKYVLVCVMNQDAILEKARINNLRWFSITATDNIKPLTMYPPQPFYKSQKDEDVSDEKVLVVKDRSYERTLYGITLPLPVEVYLAHLVKKHSMMQFPDKLTLHQAINTYNCVIQRTDF